MACTAEQLAANRLNATRSTGPRSVEGKHVSRRNSLKHGLTGQGVVLLNEDGAAIERRHRAFRERFRPGDDVDAFFVHRAAMLSVRLDRCERYQDAGLAARVRGAIEQFDAARLAEVDALLDRLGVDAEGVVDLLAGSPEGLDQLLACWHVLRGILDEPGPSLWDFEMYRRVEDLTGRQPGRVESSRARAYSAAIVGRPGEAGAGGEEPAGLDVRGRAAWGRERMRELIDGEVQRLRGLRLGLDLGAIEEARAEAADLVLVDTSPEEILARKYEAATERALNQVMKQILPLEHPRFEPMPDANPAPIQGPGNSGSFFPHPPRVEARPPVPLARINPSDANPHNFAAAPVIIDPKPPRS